MWAKSVCKGQTSSMMRGKQLYVRTKVIWLLSSFKDSFYARIVFAYLM